MGMVRHLICALTALVLVTPPANALTVSGVDVIPGSESLLFVNDTGTGPSSVSTPLTGTPSFAVAGVSTSDPTFPLVSISGGQSGLSIQSLFGLATYLSSSTLEDVQQTSSSIQWLYSGVTGPGTVDFGDLVLVGVNVTGGGAFGTPGNIEALQVRAVAPVAAVPLPAPGVLLAFDVGAIALRRKQKQASG